MDFELCIPAYNEAAIIRESVTRVAEALERAGVQRWRISVADNASTDGTGTQVRALSHPRVSVLEVAMRGKGAAILAAARVRVRANARFGFIDADLSADPADLALLLGYLDRDDADVVIGSRLLDVALVRRGALRSLSSRLFNLLRRALLGIKVVDSQCGLKVMNARGRKVLGSCTETGWFLDLEFLARCERAGLRIQEVPVHWDEERFAGRGSKLRVLRDGVAAVAAMQRIRARLD
jgi:glycosyltransferase involved in cell wall biosynthesis